MSGSGRSGKMSDVKVTKKVYCSDEKVSCGDVGEGCGVEGGCGAESMVTTF